MTPSSVLSAKACNRSAAGARGTTNCLKFVLWYEATFEFGIISRASLGFPGDAFYLDRVHY